MSNDDIRQAQVEAGEAAVVQRLRDKGLLPPEQLPKLDGVTRFRISTHSNGYYCVSIPDYYGGEVVSAANYDAARQLITRLTEALANAVRCVGHLHTSDCPMQNYETPCKCWVTPARDALDAAAVAKERAL